MASEPDQLIFALTGLRESSWSKFKLVVDAVYVGSTAETGDTGWGYERFAAARTLDALGHVEFTSQRQDRWLVVAPPVMAMLPVPGLPRAILCGARSGSLVQHIKEVIGTLNASVEPRVRDQRGRNRFAPSVIELQSVDLTDLKRIAEHLRLRFQEVPPAWLLAELAGGMDEYDDLLEWSDEPELTWRREDFNPDRLAFTHATGSDAIRLSRYQHPRRPLRRYEFWQGAQHALVDPAWGRFLVLRDRGRSVLRYVHQSSTLEVEGALPLPRLLARSVTLCSGLASKRNVAQGRSRWIESYEAVPLDVALAVAAKVDQELMVT